MGRIIVAVLVILGLIWMPLIERKQQSVLFCVKSVQYREGNLNQLNCFTFDINVVTFFILKQKNNYKQIWLRNNLRDM